MIPAFEEQFRIASFYYMGSGKSDLDGYDPERCSRLDGYADNILDICHTLDLEDVILVGHSVSTTLAVLSANREPGRFDRLLLIGPSSRYFNDSLLRMGATSGATSRGCSMAEGDGTLPAR